MNTIRHLTRALLAAVFTVFAAALPAWAAPGDPDALDANVVGVAVYATAVQPDGKTIIAGEFTSVLGVARTNIARLNADGTLDAGFDPKANSTVQSVAVQADGKVLLGGSFSTLQPNGAVAATGRSRIARLNADGTLDAGFDPKANNAVHTVAVQADGRVLLGGAFSTLQPNGAAAATLRSRIARLNADGTLDAGFDPKASGPVYCVAVQADGKVLLGGVFLTLAPNGAATASSRLRIARVHSDGTLDSGFDPKADGAVHCLAVQADGKVLLGGAFTTLQPNGVATASARSRIARVHADGTLDGFAPEANNIVYSVAVQADGKVLLGGAFTTLRTFYDVTYVVRVNADGSLEGITPQPNNIVYSVAVQADGKVLLGGTFTSVTMFQPDGSTTAISRNLFARLENDEATQSLFAGSTARVFWNRGGAGPELSQVTFEQSPDGTAWTALGAGTRVGTTANWQIGGLALPASGNLRARGQTAGSYQNGSSGLIEQVSAYTASAPVFPTVTTEAATDISTYIAIVHATVSSNGAVTDVTFEYSEDATLATGVTSASTPQPLPADATGVAVSRMIGLQGGTTYYFRARATNTGETVDGAILSFTTPPSVSAPTATGIESDRGTLGGTVRSAVAITGRGVIFCPTATNSDPALGDPGVTVVAVSGTTGVFTVPVGLDAETAYSFKAYAIHGGGTIYTSAETFITPATLGVGAPEALDADLGAGGVIHATVVQPDGKTIIAGSFLLVRGVGRSHIARLNTDGTLDLGFDPQADNDVFSVALQADGKVLVGGQFSTLQPNGAAVPTARYNFARLNADGTLDSGFDPKPDSRVQSVAVQADGKVLIGGSFTTLQPNGAATATTRRYIARVNATGTLDAGFNPNPDNSVNSVAVQADGKVLIGGNFSTLQSNGAPTATGRQGIARVTTTGTLDLSFDPKTDGSVISVAVQADGKVLLGGSFRTLQPNGARRATTRNNIARVNADGTLDLGFDPKVDSGFNSYVTSMAVQADGKVLLGGNFSTLQPNGAATATARRNIARVHADGTLDLGFDPQANDIVFSVALQADGKVLLGGFFTTFQPNGAATPITRTVFARLKNDAATQSLFAGNTARVIWNRGGAAPELSQVTFERSPNGTTWTTLGTGTRVGTTANWQLGGLSIPATGNLRARGRTAGGYTSGSSGRIEQVSAYTASAPVLPTVTTNAATDITFGGATLQAIASSNGLATEVSFQYSEDATLATGVAVTSPAETLPANATGAAVSQAVSGLPGGTIYYFRAHVTNAQGETADGAILSFITPPSVTAPTATAIESDRATLGGTVRSTVAITGRGVIFCPTATNSDPALGDPGVTVVAASGTTGVFTVPVSGLDAETAYSFKAYAIHGGGTIYTSAATFSTPATPGVGAPEALDANVGGGVVYATAVQPDGKMIIAGQFTSVLGEPRRNIARLNADGSLDLGFDPQADDIVFSVAVQADGKVLLGGQFFSLQPNDAATETRRQCLARLNADGTLDLGFDPKPDGIVKSVALQADGKLLLVGQFNEFRPNGAASPTGRRYVARVNADGTLDSFDPHSVSGYVFTVAVQADGKVLLGGDFTELQPNGAATPTARRYIARVNANGTLDLAFDPKANNPVHSVAVQADGKVLLGGSFTTLQPNGAAAATTRDRIARLNADGTLDAGFDPEANGTVHSVAVQADGKVLLGGTFTTLRSAFRRSIARVNADGTPDSGFNPQANNTVHSVAVQADGKVLLGGAFTTLQPSGAATAITRHFFARLHNDAATQTLFATNTARVFWNRGGAGAELSQVTFEQSPDGAMWTALGMGTRVGTTAHWQISGLALPTTGNLRARGRTVGGYQGGSSGLIEQVIAYSVSAPVFPTVATEAATDITIGGATLPATLSSNGVATEVSFEYSEDATLATGVSTTSPAQALPANATGSAVSQAITGLTGLTTYYFRAHATNAQGETTDGAILSFTTLPAPAVVTRAATGVSTTGSTLHATVGSKGAATDVTFQYSTDATLATGVTTTSPAQTLPADATGVAVSKTITGLTGGTFYYFRASATNSDATVNGAILSFSTAPSVTAPTAADLEGHRATLGGTVGSAAAMVPITGRGVVFSLTATNSDPTIGGTGVTEVMADGTTGVFTVPVSGLIAETGYSFKAYATISGGTGYTSVATFTTTAATDPGELDALDANVGGNNVLATAVQPDGKMIIAGDFLSVLGVPRRYIARLNADGTLDAGFDPQADFVVTCVAVQADGKVLLGGFFSTLQPNGAATATARQYIARLNADGTLDLGFDPKADRAVNSVAVQADGKVLLGGRFFSLQPNGAATATGRNRIARLNADGTVDNSFNPHAAGEVNSVAVQADGKVLIGGEFSHVFATPAANIARFNADGTLDSFFPQANNIVYSVAVQADGKVLLGGRFTALQPNGAASPTSRQGVARVHADGTLDNGFDPKVLGEVYSVAVQADGKVLLGGGYFSLQPNGAASPTSRNGIARVHADGTLDLAFDPKPNAGVSSVAVQADGKVLLGGGFTALQPNDGPSSTRNLFARLNNDPATHTLSATYMLSAPGAAQLLWSRSGAGPELSQVTFETSTDAGNTWTALGNGTRVGSTADWQIAGLSLVRPCSVRALGRTSGGLGNGSSGLIAQVVTLRVEHAPAGTDGTVSVPLGGVATLSAASFGFTDPLDVPPNLFAGVKITTLPPGETLTLKGADVNAGDIISADALIGNVPWAPRESIRKWFSIASSADGSRLAAVVQTGKIYTSINAGASWTARENDRNWYSIASSTDGSMLAAVAQGGMIYTSVNAGVSWTARESDRNWYSIASSADGMKLVAVVRGGKIYTSTDAGANWSARDSDREWYAAASSADGSKLVAVENGGQIYTSTNAGVNWTARETDREWWAVSSSTDGTRLVAVEYGGQIYTSIDSGANWTARETDRNWFSVASSADGTKLVAGVDGGHLYLSSDSGVSWTPRESDRAWFSVASSADGSRLVAGDFNGQPYTSPLGLVFTPGSGTGSSYVSLTFQVIDDGSVPLDPTPNTLTFVVPPAKLVVEQPLGQAQVSGSTVAFGDIGTNVAVPLAFRVSNTGSLDLRVTPSVTGTNAAMFTVLNAPTAAIGSLEGATFQVQAKVSSGAKTATLHLASNDPDQPDFTVLLTATGVAPIPPSATTLAAGNLGTTGATLNGTVDASGSPCAITFEYGLTNDYGTTVSATPGTLSTAVSTPVSAAVTGLAPHTLYHFRVRAGSDLGLDLGSDKTFTTGNSAPVAAADTIEVVRGPAGVPLNVLANDTDADGDLATFAVTAKAGLSPSTAGTLTLTGGKLTFAPSATFGGATFSYTMTDGFGQTDTATVTLTSASSFSIDPATKPISSEGTDGVPYSITVTTTGAWSASEAAAWIGIAPTGAQGSGTVLVTVQPNASTNPRTGTIQIGTETHTVTQAGVDKPVIGPVAASYPAIVGGAFSLEIPTVNGPVTYKATKLPPGLTLSNATGVLSGVPTTAGAYAVTVTAKNASAPADDTLQFTINVTGLATGVVGSFQGLIERDPVLNRDLASRIELKTTATGAYTGKIITGTTAITLKGQLTADVNDPAHAQLTLPIASLDATLHLTLDDASDSLTGTLSNGTNTAPVNAWRNAWAGVVGQAAEFDGLHTFYLEQPDTASSLPQGFGYGSFTVKGTTGALTVSGKVADDAPFTTATFVGQGGQVLIYAPLYSSGGSLAGVLTLTPGANAPAGNTLTGTPTWAKPPLPAKAKDTAYARTGFFAIPLTVGGGTYTAPAPGERVLALPAGNGNGKLGFKLGGLDDEGKQFDQAMTISNPKATGLTNKAAPFGVILNKVNMPTLKADTGELGGDFTLAGATTKLDRKAPFSGQIVTTADGTKGYGFFLLPKVPVGTQTVTTSPKLSGKVLLGAP